MARIFNGSSQYYEFNGNIPQGAGNPYQVFTFFCWVFPTDTTTLCPLISISQVAPLPTWYHSLMLGGNSIGTARILAQSGAYGSGTGSSSTIDNDYGIGAWIPVAGVFSNAFRQVFIFGNGATPDFTTVNGAAGEPSLTDISSVYSGAGPTAVQIYGNATIAEVAMWNDLLTFPELTALSEGVKPNLIRPSKLRGYFPLWGLQDPEPDMTGNQRNMVSFGTPPYATHAPVVPFTVGKLA